MDESVELIVYTSNGALSFEIEKTTDDFEERLTDALQNGITILDTADGSKLILNGLNVVAFEVVGLENPPPVDILR